MHCDPLAVSLGTVEQTNVMPQPVTRLPCRENDIDLWFAESPSASELAKQLCTTCPVRAACLAGALDRQEPWGVWGGEQFMDGQVGAHKRGRGRPRKPAAAA